MTLVEEEDDADRDFLEETVTKLLLSWAISTGRRPKKKAKASRARWVVGRLTMSGRKMGGACMGSASAPTLVMAVLMQSEMRSLSESVIVQTPVFVAFLMTLLV